MRFKEQRRTCLESWRLNDEEILREVERALLHDGSMSFHGFGILEVRSKRERMGRNPRTGTSAVITARRVVKFQMLALLIESDERDCA